MFGLANIKPVLEYNENDKDQGVERTYLYYRKGSANIDTDKQEVDIVNSKYWNKMLFLDGCLQSTTKDEVIYHNALVHPLMDTLQKKENILILGGGEGATAREVLRWSKVKYTMMIDYDRQLVEFMKINGSEWAMGALYDPRLTVMYHDAWTFMKTGMCYDGIIIDLTDPDLTKERWDILLYNVFQSIKPNNGGFVMNAGLYQPWDTTNLKELLHLVQSICISNSDYKYYFYTTFIPSFNGEWTFIVVSHKGKFMVEPEFSDVIPEWIRRGIKMLPDSLIENPANTSPVICTIYK